MANNLIAQGHNIAGVTTAIANGDLSKKITVDVKGEILEMKNTINTMVDQLSSFASEVTRVAREVGTEGKLGGQAEVQGVSGTWKDLTDNVNFMAGNLTSQVRGIAKVVTAVARGDLQRKLTVEAKGEIAELANTINDMTETLATFADQVTTVAREVGVEGKLGGQASVPGAAGTWRDLTDNVNRLAANLTTQVRSIADVATAVTKGDLTRSIQVEAQGEVAALKDNINEMIRNLKDTTRKNSEQDWLKTNLAKFSRMLQGQKDLVTVGRLILSELAPVVSAQQGMLYTVESPRDDSGAIDPKDPTDEPRLKLLAGYATGDVEKVRWLRLGQGLVGQCALDRQRILLTNVPKGYIAVSSSLGSAPPKNVLVMPIMFEAEVKGVLELASLESFSPTHQVFLDTLCESIGIVLNTIEANMRTEELLTQSQSLAVQLQSRQRELQKSNRELEEKAKLLADQNVEVERKNAEVEHAREALEEKAKQLALTSKYKSEFLANMSHELRTPLNSLLILSDQLSRNQDRNLSQRQVEFCKTIHDAGNDLLGLINDILDLSKIESGTVTVEVGELVLADLCDYVERTFRHVAENRKLEFSLEFSPNLPATMHSDAKRLQQVLKNLLSNAFKFTESGRVSLRVEQVSSGWSPDNEALERALSVLAFQVSDTGIGIAPEKLEVIFESFQQADGSTSRKYGGTGLGLTISREISRMLGGEIRLASTLGKGSTFTLYLPKVYGYKPGVRRQNTPPETAAEVSIAPVETPDLEGALDYAAATPDVPPERIELGDDRADIRPDDRVILIVENDQGFARILFELAREKGFKALITSQGSAALMLAREFAPDIVTLDIRLPDMDGWRVLDRLKGDMKARHIPIYVISTDDGRERALSRGAVGFTSKPIPTRSILESTFEVIVGIVERNRRTLLVVDADQESREKILDLVGGDDVLTLGAGTAAEAHALSESGPIDCVSVTLRSRINYSLLERLFRAPALSAAPVVFYAARDLSVKEEQKVKSVCHAPAIRVVKSPERLLDETALFLHREVGRLPESKKQLLIDLHQTDSVLAGRKVLVVDDDIRNIFATMSLLERHRMRVETAETGKAAIEILRGNADTDIVLMDIMMPVMDGYDTMREIRKLGAFQTLPIVAVTSKAMKGDREKCIEAGATDYLAKPVDADQLLSLIRALLFR
jgi:signal transduction histidine kinase/DNA-binding response OmpR family regulator/HAMP domain-containing protein